MCTKIADANFIFCRDYSENDQFFSDILKTTEIGDDLNNDILR